MKKFNFHRLVCLALIMLGFTTVMTAQEVRTFNFNHEGKTGLQMNEQTRGNVSLTYNIDEMSLSSFTYDGEEMQAIGIADISLPNVKGLPNVPSYTRAIAIPQGAQAVLHIKSFEQQVIKNVNVEPSLGVQVENEEPDTDYTKDMKVYSQNSYYPAEFATVSAPTSLRGVDIVNVTVNPIRFNPVTKEAIVYHNIEFEVEFVGGNGHFGDDRLRSPYFDPILAQNIMNYSSLPVIDYEARMQQWLRDGADGAEYIIVIPNNDGFVEPAERLRDYRMAQGILTEVIKLEDMPATTTQMMKTWFHNAYNTWEIAPVAILLFADHNTNMGQGIPAEEIYHSSSYGNCITDNQYADVSGDYLPDMIFSRLIAANPTEAAMMADKQIEYEYTNPNMDANSYNVPITALGWQTERWFQLCSEVVGGYFRAHGKNPQRINCIYQGTPGSVWSSAQNTNQVVTYFGPTGTNYIPQTPSELGGWTGGTPDQIVVAINQGTMLVQHRDHGLEEGWGEPAFRNSHVAQLTNVGKMPFVFSINCLTGQFDLNPGPCFAEAFMRRTYNGQNAGAVGMICPTDVSYSFVNDALVWGIYDQFDPDFMPTLPSNTSVIPAPVNANSGNWLPAFGLVAGKYFLAETSWPYNTDSKRITYQMFTAHCDAFLRLYSEVPETMIVQHQDVQLAGTTTFQVTAPAGATIALTKGEGENLEIVAVAQATGSVQNVEITSQVPPTILKLTVTGQNYLRYEAEIEVIPASGPYIVINEYELCNQATQLNFGEQAGFDIQLKNVGSATAPAGTMTLTTDSEFVTMINDNVAFGAINANTIENISEAFTFSISDEVPNKTIIDFLVTITSGSDTYESHILMRACAPEFEIGNVTITEINGNGNGRLDPGETVTLSFPIENTGKADSWATDATLVINNAFMQLISDPTVTVSSIAADATTNVEFTIYVGNAPSGFAADYALNVESGVYTATRSFTSKIGLNVEDFELGELDPDLWTNDASNPWRFDTEDPYEGNYCMKSGAIGNNAETSLVLTYDVAENDSIAFYYKVSSEANWDKMFFYIDNTEMDNWSGTVGWTRAQYSVSAGNHTFRWKYKKDSSQTGGSDCVWIDYVILPRDRNLAVSAGLDMEICKESTAQLNGYAANQTSLRWTTEGDGTFDDATIMNPIYTPGPQDIANGNVTLTLTASKGSDTLSDTMTVTFRGDVSIELPTSFDEITACMGVIDVKELFIVHNADEVIMTSHGDGEMFHGVYTFGEQDIANGSVTITIAAYGCNEVVEEIVIGYQGVPTVTGTENVNTCSLDPISVAIAFEQNWGYFVGWTTAGTGTFSELTSEETTYTPSEEDFNNGSVVLTAEYADCEGTTYNHTVTVTFTQIDTLPMPEGPTDVYNNEAVTTYTVAGSDMFTSYTWTLEPADAGTMVENGNSVTITWNMNHPDTDVELSVIGHAECGDSEPSAPLAIVLRGFGIDEVSNTVINIHPNPTNDIINVSIENISADVQITLYNNVGQVVYTKNESVENGLNTVINLSDFTNGAYILQIRSDKDVWMKRVIKK